MDKEFGGYFTSLDRDGSVYDYTKYMWMQWRIVYMFSELHLSEYSRPGWLDIAERGFDFLYKHGRDETGHYYFALNRKGEPSIAAYNIFSDCFAAMGSAALYKATGTDRYRRAAEDAMNGYLARIDNPKAQWEKSLAGRQRFLSLGHYMMLANLGVIMDECLDADRYRSDLDSAISIVLDRFWNPELGLMFENVLPNGGFDLESCEGRMLNPGHVLEAMWFILNYFDRNGGDPHNLIKVAKIIKAALKTGWDTEHGGLFYFMDAQNKPHLELQWDMKLWWPQCEALIACLYAFKMTGDREFYDWFVKFNEWTWNHFRDPEFGEWYGYLNRQGAPTHSLKGGKWKTFFHLPRCLLMSVRLMQDIKNALTTTEFGEI
ncbi:AGE family epimerase/isomerase [Tichowtungia aerotolerans]|uniref:AGE family epimerase/isomerase n=1 Tax=Tichowtungia aerotolerans TaxID=2697043 RepID=A0A6P1M7X8_9BACT|nr:AGE family epimerase/isomerase [Tichowtungia aerotolerans]QHI70152.1 AGE family epimerase/isomerase [Tichowtungia aerotolerans]